MGTRDPYKWEGLGDLVWLFIVIGAVAAGMLSWYGCTVHLHLAPTHIHRGEEVPTEDAILVFPREETDED
jgi:hypothetical protein